MASGPGRGDDLAAGEAAGEYVIDHRIGGGAMGDVYAGRHPVIGKKVAIKVLKRELAARADGAERFLREARAVNQVDHPAVVDVFALGRLADGRLYLVMDLLAGESLRVRIGDGPLPPAVTLAILRQVAAALDAAHARGVIHRDLKPDNIVVTGPPDRPAAHVLDFGIAKLVADAAGEDALATLTGQGAWLGTPAYMAPEQWSADGATAASDRYALGIVAYELLTGRPPFRATTLPGMMEQHFRAAAPSVTASGAGLDPALDRVFARLLAKEPGARPATAAAVVDELEAALAGRTGGGGPARPRRGRGAAAAAVAGVVVVAAGAAIVVGGTGRERASGRVEPRAREVGARVQVTSRPPGARVRRGGVDLGVTPLVVADVAAGETVELALSRPGYAPARRAVTVGDEPVQLDVALALVTGFEGAWTMPDGALRQFERRGEQVAGFALSSPGGERTFLRMFEFVPTDDSGVAFTASEPHVDERAPDEPSCNIPLRAEYRYHPVDDSLELRREKAQYALTDGRCVLQATAWGEPRSLTRLAGAAADAPWAESRAGGAALANAGPADGSSSDGADTGDADEPTPAPPPKTNARPAPAPTKAPPQAKGKEAAATGSAQAVADELPAQAPVDQAPRQVASPPAQAPAPRPARGSTPTQAASPSAN